MQTDTSLLFVGMGNNEEGDAEAESGNGNDGVREMVAW